MPPAASADAPPHKLQTHSLSAMSASQPSWTTTAEWRRDAPSTKPMAHASISSLPASTLSSAAPSVSEAALAKAAAAVAAHKWAAATAAFRKPALRSHTCCKCKCARSYRRVSPPSAAPLAAALLSPLRGSPLGACAHGAHGAQGGAPRHTCRVACPGRPVVARRSRQRRS